jgi:hypothetical protein
LLFLAEGVLLGGRKGFIFLGEGRAFWYLGETTPGTWK